MKYDSRIPFYLLTILLAIGFVGCGSQGVKSSMAESEVAPELMPTLEYVPVLELDKEGNPVMYEAMANPYIKRGRIKKSSVNEFIAARRAFNKNDLGNAKELLLSLTENDKSLSGPWVMLGDIAEREKSRSMAIEHYEKALTVNRKNMNAWLKLAQAQRVQGKYIQAQNTYSQALAIWKDCPEAHLNLAVLYDLYLNLPLRAQKHMEAYMFLSGGGNEKVAEWLEEIQTRTGVAQSLPADKSLLKPVS